jgi:hypothetical protein
MAEQSYLVDDPGTYDALLTTCNTCMPNKADTCPDCTPGTTEFTINGVTPDGGWPGGEDITQAATRSNKLHRWPYQILTKSLDLSCDTSCVYLVRIQYTLETSSTRRSFFQCGFSDIWLVERYHVTGELAEMFVVATSLPLDIKNDQLYGDYTLVTSSRMATSSADQYTYFNPYGLRERYDQLIENLEPHVGTLMFFARGNDKIRFRLAQHTNLNASIDINPDDFTMQGVATEATHEDYKHSKYNVGGTFKVKIFTRPIPGGLIITSAKDSEQDEQTIKYHPKLFS